MKLSFISKIQNLFKDAKQINDIGLDKLNSQNYAGAISDFTKAINIDKKFYEAYAWRGKAYFLIKQFNLAIDDFSQVILLTPKCHKLNPFFYRGTCKLKLRDFQEAIKDYNDAIGYGSDDFDVYYNRGIANYELDNYLDSIKDYDNAIKLGNNSFYEKPKYDKVGFANVYYCRASSKEQLEDFKGALEDYSEAIKYNPKDKLAYSDRAEIYKKLGEVDLALADSKKVKELENIQDD